MIIFHKKMTKREPKDLTGESEWNIFKWLYEMGCKSQPPKIKGNFPSK